ncbi:DUF397 domain-containing protein [Streptomyces cylindrosporus]|uniref:DUF397 domain-containing protein n=1 Tax=Streptomyces cylindrosporus TaxID=2927583 RepID=A0ABS9YGV9_9ACTN|nr:DUF397 domain-containing protein [Streptomyces cylindrosporus]MCI3276473.1 DUF397 domain-containing protein [Streptomyces cylindrosporus]
MSAEPRPAHEYDWVKSSYSGGNTTECVEAAFTSAVVLIRDSKRPDGPQVSVSVEAWGRFVAGPRNSRQEPAARHATYSRRIARAA